MTRRCSIKLSSDGGIALKPDTSLLKLVQSYALDALDWLDEARESKPASETDLTYLLEGVRKAAGESHASLGLVGSRDSGSKYKGGLKHN